MPGTRTFFVFIIAFCLVYINVFGQAAEEKFDPDEAIVKSIYFGGGSYYVDGYQLQKLQEFLSEFKDLNQYIISIHSHTDNIGGERYNKWLSRMRSESVLYELILQSVPSDNIYIRDFGQNNPVFDNSSYDGKQKNRRVDILFERVVF